MTFFGCDRIKYSGMDATKKYQLIVEFFSIEVSDYNSENRTKAELTPPLCVCIMVAQHILWFGSIFLSLSSKKGIRIFWYEQTDRQTDR